METCERYILTLPFSIRNFEDVLDFNNDQKCWASKLKKNIWRASAVLYSIQINYTSEFLLILKNSYSFYSNLLYFFVWQFFPSSSTILPSCKTDHEVPGLIANSDCFIEMNLILVELNRLKNTLLGYQVPELRL